jgi:beta-lactamase superfamily II metal-dependent hydrolase
MPGADVTVSMYNVGFGDAFVLRFPAPDRDRVVLIDCGSIKGGSVGSTAVVVDQIIDDVTVDGRARIDVVVATHRHKDHVSGFASDLWRNVEVGEVWLPWTENPDDDEARDLLEEMASFAKALAGERRALDAALGADGERELLDHVLENTLDLSNDKALTTLHRGFRGGAQGARRRFLDRSADVLACELLPGVTVHVLGPSRDRDVLRDMNPPSGESFIRARAGGLAAGEAELALLPFPAAPALAGEPPDQIKELLDHLTRESALMGAVALEAAVNNTSLMLVFEIGQAVLLFPGDAQWGTWKLNLDDPRRVELLGRTTFYKVGHHGSHNATPVTFVDDVLTKHNDSSSGVWAAASVTPHGRFDEIPKANLLTNLRARLQADGHVVRSDEPPAAARIPAGMRIVKRKQKPIRYDFTISTV